MWALLVFAVVAPLGRYIFWLPGRHISRWLWKKLPEGRLRRFLLKKIGGEPETWPKLPPGP
jgi:hypothetical protein